MLVVMMEHSMGGGISRLAPTQHNGHNASLLRDYLPDKLDPVRLQGR